MNHNQKKNSKKRSFLIICLIFSSLCYSKNKQSISQQILVNDYHAIFWARYIEHKNPKLSFEMFKNLITKNQYSYKWFIDLLHKMNQFQLIRQITPLIKSTYPELLKKDPEAGFQIAHALVRPQITQQIVLPISYNPEAMDILVDLNNRFPEDYKISTLTSMLYDLNQEPQNALAVSEKYLNTSPNRASNFIEYFKNAARYLKLGKTDRAIENVKKSLDLQPRFINGWLFLASIKEQAEKIEEALEHCLTALEIIDEEGRQDIKPKVTQYLLRLFFKKKQLQYKIDNFVIKKECFTQAMHLLNQKKYKQSLEHIEKCLSEKLDTKKHDPQDLFTIKIVHHTKQDSQFKQWLLKKTETYVLLKESNSQRTCKDKNLV